ncbi:MAG: DUF3006 domain-containing protein [Rubrobacter sp.]|nr:DUF3006 domain-containing protein [Rubrobacter sp.]
MQIDRMADSGWAVLRVYPKGRVFEVPGELLPADSGPGDVLEVSISVDREESRRLAGENRRLMDEMLGKGGA